MKRELLYGFFAIIATLVVTFALFIFVRGQLASYIALVLSLLVVIAFTHFYFRKPNVNVSHLAISMLGTTVLLYVLIVAILAGKGINFLYSPPFWATAIESIAIPFGYAKLTKRQNANNPNDTNKPNNPDDANNANNSINPNDASNASNLNNATN